MTAPLGARVLEWMLRRQHQAVRLEHDLVLVHDSPVLADVGPSVDVRGDPWRVARVTGELTLRDALPEADRLIAIVPASFPPPPADIAGRTYLRRVLDLRAEDLVAAVSGQFCEALVDGWVREPANTWSNVGFFVAAGYVAVLARRDRRPAAGWLWVLALATGLGSTAFHATATLAGTTPSTDSPSTPARCAMAIAPP